MDCAEGFYNPLEGQDLGTACLQCPEFSTSPKASTNVSACVCQPGFVQTVLPDGTAKCECDAGKEIINGARCQDCALGSFKPLPGNDKCTECALSPQPLAPKRFTTTKRVGSKHASECVCQPGYFLLADPVSGQESCKLCSDTWYQGLEGTDCSFPGVTLQTLPLRPGFFRESKTAQLVRKCININANDACVGSGNTSLSASVMSMTVVLGISIEQYNEDVVRAELARLYKVVPELIVLSVSAGSLRLTIQLRTDESSGDGWSADVKQAASRRKKKRSTGGELVGDDTDAATSLTKEEAQAKFASMDTATLATMLGAALGSPGLGLVVAEPLQMQSVPGFSVSSAASICNDGYSGPYCSVCDVGYYGGGEGGRCLTCEGQGDPSSTLGMVLGGTAAILIFLVLVALKFGRRALHTMTLTMNEMSNEGAVADNLKDTVQDFAEDSVEEHVEASREQQTDRALNWRERWRLRLTQLAFSFGVKLRILVSLYQVLGTLGVSFNIPYPETYTQLLASIGTIELNLPKLLPLDCLLGGVSFTLTLVLQTAGPLVFIFLFDVAARWLRKRAGTLKAGDGESLSASLADICATLSFVLLFLLYPGSSSKVFNALLCVGFDGEGESKQRFLRVDFSIDCNSTLYVGFIFPYALVMLVVYPIGGEHAGLVHSALFLLRCPPSSDIFATSAAPAVPLYYAILLFRNKDTLQDLRNLELSAATEASRIELGSRLRGRERREYQSEIDEAIARKSELEERYEAGRARLPTSLRKLTVRT